MKILNSIKTKLKKNEAMTTKADKRNSIVTLPTQHFHKKINSFISEKHVQTINIDPTNTFQNHIRKTINQSRTLNPTRLKLIYLNLNPSLPMIKGLIKIHKPNQPIRPTVNWRSALPINYNYYKHKIKQLTPLAYTFTIKNTTQLIQALNKTLKLQPYIHFARYF
jgi:ABC-type antimicrobial peptide transport system permease subunit